jgi:hypothetical protein
MLWYDKFQFVEDSVQIKRGPKCKGSFQIKSIRSSSIFIFLSLLPSNQSSVGFADSSFSKEPIRCGGDEGRGNGNQGALQKIHFATRPDLMP